MRHIRRALPVTLFDRKDLPVVFNDGDSAPACNGSGTRCEGRAASSLKRFLRVRIHAALQRGAVADGLGKGLEDIHAKRFFKE